MPLIVLDVALVVLSLVALGLVGRRLWRQGKALAGTLRVTSEGLARAGTAPFAATTPAGPLPAASRTRPGVRSDRSSKEAP